MARASKRCSAHTEILRRRKGSGSVRPHDTCRVLIAGLPNRREEPTLRIQRLAGILPESGHRQPPIRIHPHSERVDQPWPQSFGIGKSFAFKKQKRQKLLRVRSKIPAKSLKNGAGGGNRTRTKSLGSFQATTTSRPRSQRSHRRIGAAHQGGTGVLHGSEVGLTRILG